MYHAACQALGLYLWTKQTTIPDPRELALCIHDHLTFFFYMNEIILSGNLIFLTLLYAMDSFPYQSTKNYHIIFYDIFQTYQKIWIP